MENGQGQEPIETIQNRVRQLFGKDETIFLKEVMQYERVGDKKYIVYLDYEWCVDYRELNWMSTGQAETYSQLKLLENLPDSHFTDEQRISFRRQLAQALVASYVGKPEIANLLLDTAKAFYNDCISRTVFFRYNMLGCIFILLAWILMTLFLNNCLFQFIYLIPRNLIFSSFGAVNGAFLSFYSGRKHGEYTSISSTRIWVEAFVRMFIAVVCGMVACCILSCECVSPQIIQRLMQERYGVFCVGVVAGFCECAVPSILNYFGSFLEQAMTKMSAWAINSKPQLKDGEKTASTSTAETDQQSHSA